MAIHTNLCLLKENAEVYARCHEILGIPDTVEWSKLTVEFGTDEFGAVTLMLIPSGEQVRELAALAVLQIQDSCVKPEPVEYTMDYSGAPGYIYCSGCNRSGSDETFAHDEGCPWVEKYG